MAVTYKPEGYHSVTPYLVVENAAGLIDFMKAAFGAEELMRMDGPGGKVGHAEMKIGDSMIMLADSATAEGNRVIPAMVHLYVPDCDGTYKAALAAGATSEREPADQFYGDRNAGVRDDFGNVWYIATHVEDVSPEEMKRRSQEFMAQRGQS